jgi:hypothetical protein
MRIISVFPVFPFIFQTTTVTAHMLLSSISVSAPQNTQGGLGNRPYPKENGLLCCLLSLCAIISILLSFSPNNRWATYYFQLCCLLSSISQTMVRQTPSDPAPLPSLRLACQARLPGLNGCCQDHDSGRSGPMGSECQVTLGGWAEELRRSWPRRGHWQGYWRGSLWVLSLSCPIRARRIHSGNDSASTGGRRTGMGGSCLVMTVNVSHVS